MADLVSVADAAKRLTAAGDKIDRSGLSRYLTRHAAALPTSKESGRLTLVDYDVLVAHRRQHLGKAHEVKAAASLGLSFADEQQGRLRAGRLLAIDHLAKRRADLVPFVTAEWIAHAALAAMHKATPAAAAEIAALIAREHGADVAAVAAVLLDRGQTACVAMEAAFRKAGFLAMTVAQIRAASAVLSADNPDPPEPQTLDEERAAKARMDRLGRELTLQVRRRVMIPRHTAEIDLVDALEMAKQALASAARDGADVLARAAGVDPVHVRPYPRRHERRMLALFVAELRSRQGSPP